MNAALEYIQHCPRLGLVSTWVSVGRMTPETYLGCLLFWFHPNTASMQAGATCVMSLPFASLIFSRYLQSEGQPERGEGPTKSEQGPTRYAGCSLSPKPRQNRALSSATTGSSTSANAATQRSTTRTNMRRPSC